MSRRILTAAVALPLLLIIVWLDGLWFAALVGLAAGFGAWELCRMAESWGQKPVMSVAVVFATVLAVSYHFIPEPKYPENMEFTAIFPALLAVLAAVVLLPTHRLRGQMSRVLVTLCIALVIGGTLFHAPILRDFDLFRDDEGRSLVIFLLGVTFVADTVAYFVGRTMGSHRLTPDKSWEAAIGGILGAMICGVFLASAFDLGMPTPAAAIVSAILGMSGQIGAMFEAKLKRTANIESSGRLLLGHGGIMDRMGSLMWTLVILYHLVALASGSTA